MLIIPEQSLITNQNLLMIQVGQVIFFSVSIMNRIFPERRSQIWTSDHGILTLAACIINSKQQKQLFRNKRK